jgi:hypothetical protein
MKQERHIRPAKPSVPSHTPAPSYFLTRPQLLTRLESRAGGRSIRSLLDFAI